MRLCMVVPKAYTIAHPATSKRHSWLACFTVDLSMFLALQAGVTLGIIVNCFVSGGPSMFGLSHHKPSGMLVDIHISCLIRETDILCRVSVRCVCQVLAQAFSNSILPSQLRLYTQPGKHREW